MEQTRDLVLKCLNDYEDDDRLIKELNQIIEKEGEKAYPVIFHVLTNLEIEPEDAMESWAEIITHYEKLVSILGRKVNLRTALCDYFCSIQKSLKNPKVVEIQLFEKTVKASRFDSLTGLYNRQSFDETVEREINRGKRHGKELSILFFDLDDFKEINDSFGHQIGDEVLKQVAKIVLHEKRSEDLAARYGGEEIVVILPETGKIDSLVLGERIRKRVEEMRIDSNGHSVRLTISGGLASFPENATDAKSLLKCADNALYRAKGSGKNSISFFSQDKRRYMRIEIDHEVKVRELGFDDIQTQKGKGKNICFGGILFENKFALPIGTKIQLHIPHNHDKPLFIIGTVVRVEAFGSERYDIGVAISFVEMDKTIKNEISKWLRVQRNNSPANNDELVKSIPDG
ncbi:MAG: GGDEF domain-containing protein [Deltaproteobacteria bacterium]|nr:GGDEF domain-containing protein [Deltaproteobacteria bacterium]